MFDAAARRIIDAPLNLMGRFLARAGLSANAVTLIGLALGLIAAVMIAMGWSGLALVPLLLSRLADGLDGAVARATSPSDFGGYLDITADFLFYGAIPLGFLVLDPASNAIISGFLLLSFYVNGASFLGYAILAERHDLTTQAQGIKSLYYSNGLLEGTETIMFFILICLMPEAFALLGSIFAALCFLTAGLRLYGAYQIFTKPRT